MAHQFAGIQIYAVMPARDIRAYLERHAGKEHAVDIEASLDACEHGIMHEMQEAYPGARILVRRQDYPTPNPPRSRVEGDASGIDLGELGQEVADLIAEFDFTSYVVYQDELQG